jgi:hypothetical protein
MGELDAFETRFRATYRRYLGEAPTEVDAAALARTVVAAHPVARRGLWPVALRPVRALAWLLLLGLLLAALLGAALVAGSRHPTLGYACSPGSTPDRPGPVGQPRPPLAGRTPMAFDRHAGRIVLLAIPYDSETPQTWTFDTCTNTWSRMWPNQEPSAASQIVYDVDSDATITIDAATSAVWAYDLGANAWTEKRALPTQLSRQPRLVYDPVSGHVLVQASTSEDESDPSELWSYDVERDTWTRVDQVGAPDVASAHEGLLVYDASVDRLVGYDRTSNSTTLFDPALRTWSSTDALTPVINLGYGASGGEIAYDDVTKRTIVFGDGKVIAYDAAADRWETLVDGAGFGAFATGRTARLGHWMVYDPVNDRLVVYGGDYRTQADGYWVQADDVIAFDLATRQWTVLLEASQVVPRG